MQFTNEFVKERQESLSNKIREQLSNELDSIYPKFDEREATIIFLEIFSVVTPTFISECVFNWFKKVAESQKEVS